MNLRALFPLTLPLQKIVCDDDSILLTAKSSTSVIALKEIAKVLSKEYTSLWFHRFDVELTMNTGEVYWFFNVSPQGFDFFKRNVQKINPNIIIAEPRIFSFSPTVFIFRIGIRTFKDSSTTKFSFENNPWTTVLTIILFAAMLFIIAHQTGNV